jgi:predicted TIM-barrel fold metal-dependent hydrolase
MTELHLSRRNVLRLAALTTAGLTSRVVMNDSLFAAAPDDGWIDAHSHIWTKEVDKYPLAKGVKVTDLAPPSFTAEELLTLAKQENVDRVVLICHHPYYGYDNRYLIDSAMQYPDRFRIVGALDEKQPGVDSRMRELLKQRVTGFRITPIFGGEAWLESPGMETMWRTAADTKQAMCCLINPENLPQVAKMCEKHRSTPVVIDHFARIGMTGEVKREELDQLCGLSRFETVSVKISAYYALGKKQAPYHDLVPMIKRLFETFGPQRLMWASDCPYQLSPGHTYRASISLVRDHLNFVSPEERAWLLRGTAEKVFFFS